MNWELDKLKLNNILNVMKNTYRTLPNHGVLKLVVTLSLTDDVYGLDVTFHCLWPAIDLFEIRRISKGYILGFTIPEKLTFDVLAELPNPKHIENYVKRMKVEAPKGYESLKLRFNQSIIDLENGGQLSTSSDLYKDALESIEKLKKDMWIQYTMTSVSGGPVMPPKDIISIYNIDGDSGDVYVISNAGTGKAKFQRYKSGINSITAEDIQHTCKKIRWDAVHLHLKGDIDKLHKFKKASIEY